MLTHNDKTGWQNCTYFNAGNLTGRTFFCCANLLIVFLETGCCEPNLGVLGQESGESVSERVFWGK